MVPTASMTFMVVNIIICIAVPLGAMLVISTRRNPDRTRQFPRVWRAFWCGALAFTISQVLTRLPLMQLVVPQLPEAVSGVLLSGPVASFTAGLFEETGRLVVMLLLLKAFHRWIDGVSFGLGHGGIEAVLLVAFANASNLALAVTINTGQWGAVASTLPPGTAEQIHAALTQTAPHVFLLGGVERLSAITLHIACSLIVLAGIVHRRKLVAWLAAFLLHGLFNLTAIGLLGLGVDLLIVEGILVVLSVLLWVAILRSRPLFPAAIDAPATARDATTLEPPAPPGTTL